MVKLDSTRILLPRNSINPDLSYFKMKVETDPQKQSGSLIELNPRETKVYSLPKELLPYGWKNLQLRSDGWLLETSAKVLKEDYLSGISLNTIERVFDPLHDLEKSKILTFDNRDIIQDANVFTCDCTETLDIKKNTIVDSLNAIKVIYSNYKFKCEAYPNESLVFKHSGSTVKERLVLYDKIVELKKYPKDRYMKPIVQNMIDQPFDYLRVETNIRSFKDIRKKFDLRDSVNAPKLIDILNSKEKPTLDIFDKIITPSITKESLLFQKDEIERFKHLEKISKFFSVYGIRTVLYEFDLDLNRVREYLINTLGYSKSSVSKHMIQLKNELLEIRLSQSKKNDNNLIELVNIIRERLRKVA